VVEGAVDLVTLVASFGTSATLSAAKNTLKKGAKNMSFEAINKSIKRTFKNFSTGSYVRNFRDEAVEKGYKIFQDAGGKFAEKLEEAERIKKV